VQKNRAALGELQTERRAERQKQMEDAKLLLQLNALKGLDYDPAQDGFVFSRAEVVAAIDRSNRLAEARQAAGAQASAANPETPQPAPQKMVARQTPDSTPNGFVFSTPQMVAPAGAVAQSLPSIDILKTQPAVVRGSTSSPGPPTPSTSASAPPENGFVFSSSKMTTIAPARVHGKHREATSAGSSVNPGTGLPPGVRAA